jgi:hypothetical protein
MDVLAVEVAAHNAATAIRADPCKVPIYSISQRREKLDN